MSRRNIEMSCLTFLPTPTLRAPTLPDIARIDSRGIVSILPSGAAALVVSRRAIQDCSHDHSVSFSRIVMSSEDSVDIFFVSGHTYGCMIGVVVYARYVLK